MINCTKTETLIFGLWLMETVLAGLTRSVCLYYIDDINLRIVVDVIQFPRSAKGNKYAAVFMDYLTKWVEAFPTADQSALTIVKLLVGEVITRHDVPKELPIEGPLSSPIYYRKYTV